MADTWETQLGDADSPVFGEEPERIKSAALRSPEGEVVALPAPARHWHVIEHMGTKFGYTPAQIARCDQGFITDRGRWVRRAPALRIAQRAGQLVQQTNPRELFSEDVW